MKTKALIQLLSDGSTHSGESLATELGVSRTAVWKQVKRAESKGYRIQTIRGKGYRLCDSVDLLDESAVLSLLPPQSRALVTLHVMDSVDSTNAEVIRQCAQEPAGVVVCLADTQTAGRGRRGRVWQSPPGENLYLSMGLTLPGGFAALEGLSLVIGVALTDALESMGVSGLALKWPNDLLLEGHKLAGILIELQGELEGAAQIVAGIGLNVHMTTAPAVDQAWTSLALASPEGAVKWERNRIAATLIAAILDAVDTFSNRGFVAFRERWQRRDYFQGRSLMASQGEHQGIGRGIDEAGHYRIETQNGLTTVRAGEISLRVSA
ncbi:bifunctional biotin--[acetyl-CoA-carboxylase] ligase/biotin operon repressor BirA [Marinobacter caseinilyticus]|uniref:bifunctional biotin--[acetyl-CoA-carboxylase] ligase/biotin operon repressor BirA n=1 Tax=Marinobacter caseinilyticus TaxID=2692195 RepID=UPI0014085223|nr:bifunctional biotin--[acetyl-CoA-carboxylase] ligase/biotin operon repressor BirA [Marinobacter caseinilyticus]